MRRPARLREHPRPAEGHQPEGAVRRVVERKYVDNYERVQAGQPIVASVNPVTSTVQFTLPENALPLLRDSSTRFTVAFDNYRGAAIPAALKEYVEDLVRRLGIPRVADSRKRRSGPLPHLARHVVHDHHVERRSRSRCRVAARFGRLRPGRGRDLRLDRRRGRPRHAPRGDARGAVRPRPGGRRQRCRAGERVVTAGVYQLREGERVRILN